MRASIKRERAVKSLSDIRLYIENELVILLSVVIPLIILCIYSVVPSIDNPTQVTFFAAIGTIAIPIFLAMFESKLSAYHKYIGINISLIGCLLFVCIDEKTFVFSPQILAIIVVVNAMLRGTRIGLFYLIISLVILLTFCVCHSIDLQNLQNEKRPMNFWLAMSCITILSLATCGYVAGTFYNLMLNVLYQVEKSNRIIKDMSETDKLTGLCNRWAAEDRLKVILENQKRVGGYTFAIYIDLDGFKKINDTYHHQAGDFVLKQVADRLKTIMRPNDIVCRLGGDEFVTVCHISDSDLSEAQEYIKQISTRIIKSISSPIKWEKEFLMVGASVGISEHLERNVITADELFHKADLEMLSVKRSGKSASSMNGEKFTSI